MFTKEHWSVLPHIGKLRWSVYSMRSSAIVGCALSAWILLTLVLEPSSAHDKSFEGVFGIAVSCFLEILARGIIRGNRWALGFSYVAFGNQLLVPPASMLFDMMTTGDAWSCPGFNDGHRLVIQAADRCLLS